MFLFLLGLKSELTNWQKELEGIFTGYKGSVLAKLQLQKEETVFATDAILEEVGEIYLLMWMNSLPPKKRRDIYSCRNWNNLDNASSCGIVIKDRHLNFNWRHYVRDYLC